MRRLILTLVVALASACACAAAATAFGLAPSGLATGSATPQRCDTDGLTVSHDTTGGNVTSVTVGDIADPGCEGGTLRVELTDASRTSIGSGSSIVPTDGDTTPDSVVVPVTPTPLETDVAAIQIVIEGP